MDFSNRSAQPAAAAPGGVQPSSTGTGRRGKNNKDKWGRIGVVVAALAVVILLLGVILTVSSDNSRNENKYVKTDRLQAVFLNTGQVYFGNVKSINGRNVVLSNIYYLQTNSNGTTANTNANISLVKLGCELHEPYDQMVINRDQVTFWENLQDNGQVAKAVQAFQKQNPQGQKCADQSSAASTGSSSAAQNAGSANGGSATTPKTNP
jgi:hypothetical protein